MAEFVTWVKADTARQKEGASAGFIRFMSERYPCNKEWRSSIKDDAKTELTARLPVAFTCCETFQSHRPGRVANLRSSAALRPLTQNFNPAATRINNGE
jgi:hypothetical protein